MDGSGKHKEFRSCKNDGNSQNIIFVGMRIYEIMSEDGTLQWEEASLGEETEIPLRLVPGKESEELVEAIYSELEGEILDCNDCDIKVDIFGVEVIINITVEFTQADQKILHMVISNLGNLECNIDLKILIRDSPMQQISTKL